MKKDDVQKIVKYAGDIVFFFLGALYVLNYVAAIIGRITGLNTGTEIFYCVTPMFEIGIRYSFPGMFLISAINYLGALRSNEDLGKQPTANGSES